MKRNKWFFKTTLGVLFLAIVVVSCKKEDPDLEIGLASVTSIDVTDVKDSYCLAQGRVTMSEGSLLKAGFCWGTSINPVIENDSMLVLTNAESGTDFTSEILGLQGSSTYYIRAFGENEGGVSYGDNIVINTTREYNVTNVGPSGGYVFYKKEEYSDGWKYMEISTENIAGGSTYPWGCEGTAIVTSGTLGEGDINTEAIVDRCGAQVAGYIASNSVSGGFSGWYLPNIEEWEEVGKTLAPSQIEEIGLSTFWSSSEINATTAYYYNLNDTDKVAEVKTGKHGVRVIKKF